MDLALPASLLKALQATAELIGRAYGKALGALLSRDLKQANEALRLCAELQAQQGELVRLVMRGVKDARGILPLGTIYTHLAQVGGYARSIALIAYNRYLERATNLSRPVEPSA